MKLRHRENKKIIDNIDITFNVTVARLGAGLRVKIRGREKENEI